MDSSAPKGRDRTEHHGCVMSVAENNVVNGKRKSSCAEDEELSEIEAACCSDPTRRVCQRVEDMVVRHSPPAILTEVSKAMVEAGRESVRTGFFVSEATATTLQGMNRAIDVCVLIDVSPSMRTVEDLLKQCIEKLPDILSPDGVNIDTVNCAIGFFSDHVNFINSEKVAGYKQFGTLNKVGAMNIANKLKIQGSGGTNTKSALNSGLCLLQDNRTKLKHDPGFLQHLVLVTDGNPTRGELRAFALGDLVSDYINSKLSGCAVVVHTLSLGNDVDVDVCHNIVKSTGGLMGHARNGQELLPEMRRIFAPITSSGMAFLLAISDNRPNHGAGVRYERFGILTKENREALLTLDIPPVASAGIQKAATLTLLNSFLPTQNVMMKYILAENYESESRELVHFALAKKFEEKRMQEEEQEKVRNALAENDIQSAIDISQTYTMNYNNQGLDSAAQRSSARTRRLEEMAEASHDVPRMNDNSASLMTMSLASQSFY